jgi:PIN domain nuclease of toxin-antitoxin system
MGRILKGWGVVTVGVILAAAGCKRDSDPPKLAGDDQVLATVNGHSITHYDLMHAARTMLGPAAQAELDQSTRKNLLDGLVQSRAIADKRESELSVEELAALDKQVAAYRERLLVKQYLGKHTKPIPVSEDLVAKYYEQHAAEYAPAKTRSYELLTSARPIVDSERAQILKALQDPAARNDWQAWSAELAKRGLPVVYQRGTDPGAALDPALKSMLARLAVGEASRVTLVDGRLYVARVLSEAAQPSMPLAQVTSEIRKALEPVQVQRSVEQASAAVMRDAKVEYPKSSRGR